LSQLSDDQDFFFDQEDEQPAGGKVPAKTPGKTAGKAPAKKPAKSAAKAPARSTGTVARKAPAAAAPAPAGSFFEQNVSMAVAALAVMCALLVGVIAGVLIEQSRAGGLASLPAVTSPTSGTGAAPQLTPDQLNSGQLPPGHPSVGATSSGTTSPSKTATGK
jgi:hypothetical protein